MPYRCNICEEAISEKVFDYSKQHFGKALCFQHQKEMLPERFYCSFCKEKISEKVNDYSLRHFGKALCMNHQKDVNHKKANSSKRTNQHNMSYYCNECKKAITYAVFKYSIRNFDKPLCRGCQPVNEKTISVPPTKPELLKPAGIEIGGKLPKKKMYHDGY